MPSSTVRPEEAGRPPLLGAAPPQRASVRAAAPTKHHLESHKLPNWCRDLVSQGLAASRHQHRASEDKGADTLLAPRSVVGQSEAKDWRQPIARPGGILVSGTGQKVKERTKPHNSKGFNKISEPKQS